MTDDTHNAPRGAPSSAAEWDASVPFPEGSRPAGGGPLIGARGDLNEVPLSPSASPLFGDSSVPSGSISASGPISAEPSFPTMFASAGGSFVTGPVSETVPFSVRSDPGSFSPSSFGSVTSSTGTGSVTVTGPVSADAAIDLSDIPESGEAFFRSAELRMPSLPLGGPIFAADGTDVSAQFTGGRFMCRAALPWAPGLTSPRTFVMHPDAARSADGAVLCPHCGQRWEGWR